MTFLRICAIRLWKMVHRTDYKSKLLRKSLRTKRLFSGVLYCSLFYKQEHVNQTNLYSSYLIVTYISPNHYHVKLLKKIPRWFFYLLNIILKT